ncbi:hypothetical protein BH24CHL3_BH24CHL3_06490 [soil metagenome]
MQHQTYAAIVQTFPHTFDRLSTDNQWQTVELMLRTLAALGDHLLTAELDEALSALEQTMKRAGHIEAATAIGVACRKLAATSGTLHSRATRVTGGS